MTDFYTYEPADGHGLSHNPFNAIVAPRPIGWISSRDAQGSVNLAPHSFFNAFCYTPPIIGFSSTGWKDTVRNVEETREFGWSLVTKRLAEAMNVTSAAVPHGVDEFDLAGVTKAPSRLIGAPRVAESPVSFECRLTQMFRLTNKEGAEVDTWMMLGEVVSVYIDRTLLRDGVYQTGEAYPVVRSGGPGDYFDILPENKFVMMRAGGLIGGRAMIVIGLTGSIGMGKSTTAQMFRDEGVPVLDADAVVHELYSGSAVAPVEAAFPGVSVDGSIDRARLRARVLAEPDALRRLESIVHPMVGEARRLFLVEAAAQAKPIVVLDIPLLFETGLDRETDHVVVVSAPESVQKARVLARAGMTEAQLSVITAKQVPDIEKRRRADTVVETGRGLDAARDQVRALLAGLQSG